MGCAGGSRPRQQNRQTNQNRDVSVNRIGPNQTQNNVNPPQNISSNNAKNQNREDRVGNSNQNQNKNQNTSDLRAGNTLNESPNQREKQKLSNNQNESNSKQNIKENEQNRQSSKIVLHQVQVQENNEEQKQYALNSQSNKQNVRNPENWQNKEDNEKDQGNNMGSNSINTHSIGSLKPKKNAQSRLQQSTEKKIQSSQPKLNNDLNESMQQVWNQSRADYGQTSIQNTQAITINLNL